MSFHTNPALRLLAALGFAASLSSIPLNAATTASGEPLGVLSSQAAIGNNPLTFPLIQEEVFAGIVSANGGNTLTFAAGNASDALAGGRKYYVEIANGAHEGERFDIASASGGVVTLDLSATSFSTMPSLSADVLAQARAVIRQHVTLQDIGAMFSPALAGNNNPTLADAVLIYSSTLRATVTYYLRGDGTTWREMGKNVTENAKVVPPDWSVVVQLRSGAKRWVLAGGVRANSFRVNLTQSPRSFATGFPVDLSPIEIGGFVDGGQAAGIRWVGDNNPTLADNIRIYNPGLGSFQTHYLRADGATWRLMGDNVDLSASKLLPVTGMFVVARTNPNSSYVILRPYSL